jgi:DNA mismatch repair protein MutL
MQNTKIRVLSKEVVSRIAAGEVVERPASVVKELIENSIDARATKIEVEVKDGGHKLIEITDNGDGMTRADAVLAFTPHATSKLETDEQLENIISLGFRGEALPTIASVSRVSLFTRHKSEDMGTRITVDGGVLGNAEGDSFPEGTRIQIKNIFYNTPARRKFMKSPQAEMAQISDMVCHYMMGYPEIAFKFSKSNVQIVSSSGSGNLIDAIIAIYGAEVSKGLIPLKEPPSIAGTGMSLRGYISPPNQARSSSRYITTLVNRRVVKTKILMQAINRACAAFFPKGKYPVLILDLRVLPDMIDVNVHPQKTEIRFKDEQWIFKFVWELVKTSLSGLKMIAEPTDMEVTRPIERSSSFGSVVNNISGFGTSMNIPSIFAGSEGGFNQPPVSLTPDLDQVYTVRDEKIVTDLAMGLGGMGAQAGRTPLLPVATLTRPKILAQLKNTYLLGEDEEGLFIVDQHVAHERILFDQYMGTYQDTPIVAQSLLFPVSLKLLPSERLIIRDHLDEIKALGFSIYQEDDGQFYVTAVPITDKKTEEKSIQDMLSQVLNGWESRSLLEVKEELLKLMACKAAIKAGDPLLPSEWHSLLEQLLKTENPFTCPHGRPIVVRLSVRQIETGFLRV